MKQQKKQPKSKSEQSERSERSEQSERSGRSERSERTNAVSTNKVSATALKGGLPNVFKTPNNFDKWSDRRKTEWERNKEQFLKRQDRYMDLLSAGRKGLAESVRGDLQKIRLREQQQRSSYNLGVELTKAEQNQMRFQQDFIAALGDISRFQSEQGYLTQSYLDQQYQLALQQAQQQADFQKRALAMQEQMLAEERAQQELSRKRSFREEALLAQSNYNTSLFSNVNELRNSARYINRRYIGRFM